MAVVLEHRVNTYNSVEVTDASCGPRADGGPPAAPREWEARLWQSLGQWRREGRKGVWLRLHPSQSELVPVAVRAGFEFHSAETGGLTLTAWVAPHEKNALPPGPAHFIGVAGFVLNSRDEVLCVRERSGPSARLSDFWKLPGGLVDRQEDLAAAAVCEVLEETGLQCDFERLATVQEIHHSQKYGGLARAGTTDLYCVCVLRARDERQAIVPQQSEIAAAQWVPLSTLLALRYYSAEGTVFHKMFRAAAAVAKGDAPGLELAKLRIGFSEGTNPLFTAATAPRARL
jgi:8-oxo-dGTP pyrophosphatase MutT (NUDIX family)